MTRRSLSLHGVDVGLPTAAAVVLGLFAGVCQVLNEAVLELPAAWHSYLSILLVFAAGAGISPLVGPAFRAALHLPVWAGYIVSAAMAAAVLALGLLPTGVVAHAIIGGVLVVLSALGFAPANIQVAPPVLARPSSFP